MKKILLLSCCTFLFSSHMSTNVMAKGNASKGKAQYAVCASCHGQKAEGNQALNAPALAGLQDWYLVRQLKNFKAGIRGTHPKDVYGAQMRPMSMTLATEQAIADVSAYISAFSTPTITKTKGNPTQGKALYAVCASCHGQKAEGNRALNAPALVGLQDWYLARQLKNFKAGIRGTHPKDVYGAQMRPMSMTLATNQMIDDVSAYITTLK